VPTSDQQACVADAIGAIRDAENLLTAEIQATDDTLTAIKLTHEYNNLDSYLSELLHAQNVTDDLTFANAMQALQTRVDGLQADEDAIKRIVADVATAGKIIGYITTALAFIARL
jgi:hypothetical protein